MKIDIHHARQTGQLDLDSTIPFNTAGVEVVRENSSDTRERLLGVASHLMWERGYQSTGVDELCRLANAKKGSFYHFFPSKSDLAIAAIERSWEVTKSQVFEPVFSSPAGGLDQLEMLVSKVSVVTCSGEFGTVLGCPFGSLAQEMARHDEKIRSTMQKIFDGHCRFIKGALERAQQAGEIPPGDNERRSTAIFALLQGALLLAKVENSTRIILNILPSLHATAKATFDDST